MSFHSLKKEDKKNYLWKGILVYFLLVCFVIPLPGDRGIMMNTLFPEKRYDIFQELTTSYSEEGGCKNESKFTTYL